VFHPAHSLRFLTLMAGLTWCSRFSAMCYDHDHVGRAVPGAQACEVVVEDDVEHPVQAVLNALIPVALQANRYARGVGVAAAPRKRF